MAALDESHDRESSVALYDEGEQQLEIEVAHNPEQTLLSIEHDHASIVAAVDVGYIPLADAISLARGIEEVCRDVTRRSDTPPASGGDRDGE